LKLLSEYFLQSLEVDSSYSLASILYGNFLILRNQPEEFSEVFLNLRSGGVCISFILRRRKLFILIFILLKRPPISPLTQQELASATRVYIADGTYKTLPVRATMSASEICSLMFKALGVLKDHQVIFLTYLRYSSTEFIFFYRTGH
jgi:hypothetical protein